MKRLTVGLLCWMIVGGLASCQVDIDEKPQILGMSIDGIPQENITIDQGQQLITLLLPLTLPTLELMPNFTLSRQAKLADNWVFTLTKDCPCWTDANVYIGNRAANGEYNLVKLVNRVDNKHQSSHYTVMFKRAGPLRIKALSTPSSMS